MSDINQFKQGLILVRAGLTNLDDQQRIVGRLDIPLSDGGREYANVAASELVNAPARTIYCSPCTSAKETAAIISKQAGGKVRVEEGLANLDHGLWHGKRVEEVKETQPKLFKQWRDRAEAFTPPQGESIADARARVKKPLLKMIRQSKSSRIAIVCPEPLYRILLEEIQALESRIPWIALQADGNWIQSADIVCPTENEIAPVGTPFG